MRVSMLRLFWSAFALACGVVQASSAPPMPADDSGSAEAVWFGRRFVENRLRKGMEIVVSGKVTLRGWRPQFTSPEFSPAGRESMHTARVVPVYRLVGGVTQKRVRELLAGVLERALPAVEDPLLPAERGRLMSLAEALRAAHFPEEAADARAGPSGEERVPRSR